MTIVRKAEMAAYGAIALKARDVIMRAAIRFQSRIPILNITSGQRGTSETYTVRAFAATTLNS
jgi:aspartate 1-decarboxylase